MALKIKNLIGKLEIHYHGEQKETLSTEIQSALALYKDNLKKITERGTSALAEHSKYHNKEGLEQDIDILWASFRALERFILSCNLTDAENKNYEAFPVSEYSRKHFPRWQRQRPQPRPCPPANEYEAKD